MTAAEVLAVTALAVAGASLLSALVLAGATLALRRSRARDRAALEALRAEVAALAEHRDAPGAGAGADRGAEQGPAPTAYVITGIDDLGARHDAAPQPRVPAQRIEGRLFADLVLRESVVKAAALAHGVRRAASPEVRDRVRGEMRREVKRSRKQRRADLREARRFLAAQQRADLREGEDAA